ncbi:MAG TPA: arginase [Patescibacteria group bacterium]|nr:arginase [Patescibacteria group bacterium]
MNKSIRNNSDSKKIITILGAPFLYGKDDTNRSTAPNTIRKVGLFNALKLAGFEYEDKGNIKISQKTTRLDITLRHVEEIIDIAKKTADVVADSITAHRFPLVLGGDHSNAIGSILGIASKMNGVTLIYLDTHGDFHTSQTTPSGRLHGMALALSLGLDKKFNSYFDSKTRFFDKKNTVLFGGQKFDPGERAIIEKNISLIDIDFIISQGIGKAVDKLMNLIKTDKIYISLDLDVIDKEYAPATDTSIAGALSYREIIYTLENLSKKFNVVGMDVTELSPKKDIDDKTSKLAIECITSALGHRIGEYELYMDNLASSTPL